MNYWEQLCLVKTAVRGDRLSKLFARRPDLQMRTLGTSLLNGSSMGEVMRPKEIMNTVANNRIGLNNGVQNFGNDHIIRNVVDTIKKFRR